MTRSAFPPALELFYSPKACSLATHIVLEASGVPYTATAVNIRTGDNRRPDYLRLNPSGTVPAMRVDGQVLTESQALMTFVADLVPERALLPRPGTLARARAHEWMNFISSSVHAAYRSIFRPQGPAGDAPQAIDAVRAQAHDRLAALIDTIESRLGDTPWALGEHFGAVDAYLFVFYLWSFDERLQREMPPRPRWRALAHRVWALPEVRKVVAREREVRAYDLPPEMAAGLPQGGPQR